eukprot:scaffold306_cov525-Prasinococcus_capsulatus_cf.AAC.10
MRSCSASAVPVAALRSSLASATASGCAPSASIGEGHSASAAAAALEATPWSAAPLLCSCLSSPRQSRPRPSSGWESPKLARSGRGAATASAESIGLNSSRWSGALRSSSPAGSSASSCAETWALASATWTTSAWAGDAGICSAVFSVCSSCASGRCGIPCAGASASAPASGWVDARSITSAAFSFGSDSASG